MFKKTNKFMQFLLIIVIFLILFITANKSEKENLNIDIGNNCKLPCWWGITPGQTTDEDLNNLQNSDKWEILKINLEPDGFKYILDYYGNLELAHHPIIHLYLVDNSIEESKIYINTQIDKDTWNKYLINFEFSNLIHQYGNPSSIYLESFLPRDSSIFYLYLFYEDLGFGIKYLIYLDNFEFCASSLKFENMFRIVEIYNSTNYLDIDSFNFGVFEENNHSNIKKLDMDMVEKILNFNNYEDNKCIDISQIVK